ncbi:MMPL family transporter [Streptomyces collinus]|uniref:MMPL family transporter n=1 Tax=Streptomyces collinus TaxID=42684 RepID=UPI00367D22FB
MKPFSSSTTIPGTEAQRTLDVLEKEFPPADRGHVTGKIVFRAADGKKITAGEPAKAVAEATRAAEGTRGVASVTPPSAVAGTVSADGRTGIAQVAFDAEKADGIQNATKQGLERAADGARAAGLTVELGGDAFATTPEVMGPGEVVGVLIALGVLVIVFRTLRSAIIPVATALVGVAIGVLSLLALTSVVTMDSTSIILAVMLGLAVGIDYALFIVSRHQSQVREGMDPEESAGLATGTAGGAVVFAGATVVIALAALAIVNIPFLTVMGLGAAATVVVSVLIAVTLLPAVLGLMGRRVVTSTVPVLARLSRRSEQKRVARSGPSLGERWAATTARRPWTVLITCVLGLGILAAPFTDLRLGLGGTADSHSSAARAQKLIDDGFGPGYSGALVVLVQGTDKATVASAAQHVASGIKELRGVSAVSVPVPAASGDAALVNVTPAGGPESEATTKLLGEIRDMRGGIEERTGTDVNVSGTTAVNIDVADKLSSALPVYCLLVMGLALVLLTVVFRAVAVPLKAALGFLFSLGSALGVLVAVFQWGWLSGPLGVDHTGPVLSFLPMLLVGILFGLAMDYEVFLVSRMREEYAHGTPPTEAMIRGFGHSAKVVTAAALIMIAVFGGFVLAELQVVKGMGLALAVGVLMDAFVVRMTLVPAVMTLLGHRAWWLPRFLHRILPNVDIEGERLMRQRATVQQPHPDRERQMAH